MNNIELELRTLVDENEAKRVRRILSRVAKKIGVHNDETYYYDRDGQLRIRKEKNTGYIIMKSGRIHDFARKETVVRIAQKDIPAIEEIFVQLGYPAVARWFRKREKWRWGEAEILIDFTKNYGWIIEIERLATPQTKSQAKKDIEIKFRQLGLRPTAKNVIQKHYLAYLRKWR